MMKVVLSAVRVVGLLMVLPQLSLAQATHIEFKETASPDGRWSLGWSLSGYPIDVSDPDKFEVDKVANHLVDRKGKRPVVTLGTYHYATEGLVKNRGSLIAIWRKDSRAVLIEEAARFGSASVVLVEVLDPDRPHFPEVSDAVHLTTVFKKAARERILKLHPDKKEAMDGATIAFVPKKWVGECKVECEVIAEQPKVDTVFRGTMVFVLPDLKVVVE